MKKLSILALIVSLTSFGSAYSENAASGIFVGVGYQATGVELDGKYTDTDAVVTKGTGGAVSNIANFDLGYNLAIGDSMYLGLGYEIIPGTANIGKADDAANAADVTLEASDFETFYATLGVMVSENTSLYAKYGDNEADLKTTGNFVSASKSLNGTTVAFGSATHFASGMYIQTEVGNTDYDKITVTDIGTAQGDADDATGKGDAEADPSIAYGRITLGYKF